MRWPVRIAVMALMCCAIGLLGDRSVQACTAFCATGAGQTLVGNNEDWNNPRTKIWFVPAKPGSHGRVYVGFDDLTPQGGMNERGLWFDGFAAPPLNATGSSDLPRFPGNIVDKAMAECSTVEEVVRLFNRYSRDFLAQGILMFADASGDAVSIERTAIVRKTRRHFVQTNFHQSRSPRVEQDERFAIASTMLERAGDEISVDLFRRILAATHQKGHYSTLYSNVYDLRSRIMHLYYFHDFEHVVTFDLAEELKKGERVLDIPALFPRNVAAETFAARRREAAGVSDVVVVIGVFAVLCMVIAIAVYGWIRAGREFRIGLAVLVGVVAVSIVLTALALRRHPRTSAPWIEFSIGPASGESVSIQPSMMRSDGVTLKMAVATAYNMPAIRVIGPAWLSETRYSINAVVGVDESPSFRTLLQQELQNRLQLETHVEVRPFDVLVLTATETRRLERSFGRNPSIWIGTRDAQLRGASMDAFASALQAILNRPVIDETGITGSYNLELAWGENRIASVTAALHDRFGLRLSSDKREMDALVVDRIERDVALHLLAHVGRITRGAPRQVRQAIAESLTIR